MSLAGELMLHTYTHMHKQATCAKTCMIHACTYDPIYMHTQTLVCVYAWDFMPIHAYVRFHVYIIQDLMCAYTLMYCVHGISCASVGSHMCAQGLPIHCA